MATGAPNPPVDKAVLTATGAINAAGPCVYYGYIVTVVLGAGAVLVRDGASGDIVDVILASAAVGNRYMLPHGVRCPVGLNATFGSTGTVTFFYTQG